jgi:hypothetical protein
VTSCTYHYQRDSSLIQQVLGDPTKRSSLLIKTYVATTVARGVVVFLMNSHCNPERNVAQEGGSIPALGTIFPCPSFTLELLQGRDCDWRVEVLAGGRERFRETI